MTSKEIAGGARIIVAADPPADDPGSVVESSIVVEAEAPTTEETNVVQIAQPARPTADDVKRLNDLDERMHQIAAWDAWDERGAFCFTFINMCMRQGNRAHILPADMTEWRKLMEIGTTVVGIDPTTVEAGYGEIVKVQLDEKVQTQLDTIRAQFAAMNAAADKAEAAAKKA